MQHELMRLAVMVPVWKNTPWRPGLPRVIEVGHMPMLPLEGDAEEDFFQ